LSSLLRVTVLGNPVIGQQVEVEVPKGNPYGLR
jgi:hypothetical protein